MQPFFIIKKARLQRSGAFAMIFNWILKRVNQQNNTVITNSRQVTGNLLHALKLSGRYYRLWVFIYRHSW